MQSRRTVVGGMLAAALCAGAQTEVRAADPSNGFYAGKTVTIIAGYPAGDGFDLYARIIARHLPKHLPGAPTIIVRNMVGAGSLVAANYINDVAAQDGTNVALIGAGIPFSPLLGVKEATFEATKMNWLPSPNVDVSGVVLWHESPVNTIEDARKRETPLATATSTSTASFFGRLTNQVLGTKFKLIQGYNGMSPAFLAMERGEVEGHPSVTYSTLAAQKPDWVRDKKAKFIVQFGRAKHPELPNVPFLRDEAKTDEDRLLIDMASAPLALGRVFVLGPKVQADRVQTLREAFAATYKDPELLSEAAQLRLEFSPDAMSGEEVRDLVNRTYAAPATVIQRLRALYEAN